MAERCCLTCAHGALRDPTNEQRDKALRAMARMGWINCSRSACGGTFCAPEGTCEHWAPATAEIVQKRLQWAERFKQ